MSENYNNVKSCGEYDVLVIGASFGGVCAALGQAAGVSAAISAKTDIPLRELDTELVRRELSSERQNEAWRIAKS